jgi:hypothetical protein
MFFVGRSGASTNTGDGEYRETFLAISLRSRLQQVVYGNFVMPPGSQSL